MSTQAMVDFLKAIADAERLRIVGMLAQRSASLSEICELLGFHPSDAGNHLDQLIQGGVVCLSGGLYGLDSRGLETLFRRQFEATQASHNPDPDLEKKRRRILVAHLNPDGTIKTIPMQAAKLRVLLQYLINSFTVGANYSEKEVNLILAHFHPDTSGLRRDLIDSGMLERERNGSRYWRPK